MSPGQIRIQDSEYVETDSHGDLTAPVNIVYNASDPKEEEWLFRPDVSLEIKYGLLIPLTLVQGKRTISF